jgi:hypothetical protein
VRATGSSNLDTRNSSGNDREPYAPCVLRAGSLALLLLVTRPCSRQAPQHPMPDTTPYERFTECPAPAPVHARRKVANIKCELLNDFASANLARRTAVLADDAALELDDDETQGQDACAAAAAESPQDDENDGVVELTTADAEFERLVGGDT